MRVRDLRKLLDDVDGEAIVEEIVILEPSQPRPSPSLDYFQEAVWDHWFMAYPAALIGATLVYVPPFVILLWGMVMPGWVSPATFDTIAWTGFQWCFSGAGIIGSLWALHDYALAD